jgi:phosphorylcholine metabolism protein LicD
LDLAEFYQSLENKDPEAVDREFTKFIYRQVSWTASKYRPGKKEKKVASELKQYSEALQLFFYDLDDKDG